MLPQTVSIVIPLYNEEEVVSETVAHLKALKDVYPKGWVQELIFVDDGSTDRTLECLQPLLEDVGCKHQVICLARNFGHQLALTAGLDRAHGEYVAAIDADLQDPPEKIPEMLNIALQGYDIVYGQRTSRSGETIFKKASAKAFYRLLNAMSDVEMPKDIGDFRLVSHRVAEDLRGMRERHRYIRGMIPWLGYKSFALQYERHARFAGETKYPMKKMIGLAFDAALSFSTRPLDLALRFGVLLTMIGFAGLTYATYLRFATDAFAAGLVSIMFLIAFFSGIQIALIGLVGVYVARIFEEVKDRPLYVVSRILAK